MAHFGVIASESVRWLQVEISAFPVTYSWVPRLSSGTWRGSPSKVHRQIWYYLMTSKRGNSLLYFGHIIPTSNTPTPIIRYIIFSPLPASPSNCSNLITSLIRCVLLFRISNPYSGNGLWSPFFFFWNPILLSLEARPHAGLCISTLLLGSPLPFRPCLPGRSFESLKHHCCGLNLSYSYMRECDST